jgi:hypothetical protein
VRRCGCLNFGDNGSATGQLLFQIIGAIACPLPEAGTRLIANTSILMLHCGPTVSWTSGRWWSANDISFAHP